MNILFLTMSSFRSVEQRGIYTDLMRKFRDEGHQVFIVAPMERRFHQPTMFIQEHGVNILQVKTLNVQKTNVIEKGCGQLSLEFLFKRAIHKYMGNVTFDLVLYSTPPITFSGVISSLKKKNPHVMTYLLLKDIFPQNAVDLGMFSKSSLIYRYFRHQEKKLYRLSDYIGCMSPANVDFVKKYNPDIDSVRVEVAPNSVELVDNEETVAEKNQKHRDIKLKYGLPLDKIIFVYGGNLGKPQGIDFLMSCLEKVEKYQDAFFLIVGGGTEYGRLAAWYHHHKNGNVKLLKSLPKEEYDLLVSSCDVGLIFLDHRFTIPNYPSRLLSYLEYKMPIIAATDKNTDIGKIAEDNGYGYWCESIEVSGFLMLIEKMLANPDNIKQMGENGYQFLKNNYLVEHTYQAIMRHT